MIHGWNTFVIVLPVIVLIYVIIGAILDTITDQKERRRNATTSTRRQP